MPRASVRPKARVPAIVRVGGAVPGGAGQPAARRLVRRRLCRGRWYRGQSRARERRTAAVPAAPIVSATGTCRAVVPVAAEAAVPSAAEAADTTAQARVRRAAAGLRDAQSRGGRSGGGRRP